MKSENKYVRLESKIYIDYIKYLGVVIDQNLSWKYRIDSIVTKISKNVGLIAIYATLYLDQYYWMSISH